MPLKLITETREIWNLDKKFLAKILKFAQFNTQFNSQIIKKTQRARLTLKQQETENQHCRLVILIILKHFLNKFLQVIT